MKTKLSLECNPHATYKEGDKKVTFYNHLDNISIGLPKSSISIFERVRNNKKATADEDIEIIDNRIIFPSTESYHPDPGFI